MTRLQKSLVPLLGGAGVLHFLAPEPFDGIVPPQLPGNQRSYTYASGAVELLAAALLANNRTRAIGAVTTTALFTAVWPANMYMTWLWRHKPWYLQAIVIARLPLQIPLIRAAWGMRQYR